jgi:hypothetical protein
MFWEALDIPVNDWLHDVEWLAGKWTLFEAKSASVLIGGSTDDSTGQSVSYKVLMIASFNPDLVCLSKKNLEEPKPACSGRVKRVCKWCFENEDEGSWWFPVMVDAASMRLQDVGHIARYILDKIAESSINQHQSWLSNSQAEWRSGSAPGS